MSIAVALVLAFSLQSTTQAATDPSSEDRQLAIVDEVEKSTLEMFRFMGACKAYIPITSDDFAAELDKKFQNAPEQKQRILEAHQAGASSPEAATLTEEACNQGILTRMQATMKLASAMLETLAEDMATPD